MYHLAGTSVAWTLEVFAITGVAHSLKPFPTWFAVQRTVTWSFRGIQSAVFAPFSSRFRIRFRS